jgi:hypothetical protein
MRNAFVSLDHYNGLLVPNREFEEIGKRKARPVT